MNVSLSWPSVVKASLKTTLLQQLSPFLHQLHDPWFLVLGPWPLALGPK